MIDNIGVSEWSYNKQFKDGSIDHAAFFSAIHELGLHKAELNSPFFASIEPDYVATIGRAAAQFGVKPVNIAIDDWSCDLSSNDEANRQAAVAVTVAWMDVAVALGCPNVRNNTGGIDLASCTKSFTELAAAAKQRGLRIVIEAHGGFSSDASKIVPLVEAVRAVHGDTIGIIPDFGNVINDPGCDRYCQIGKLAPYAVLVHPKMHDFDENGDQPEWDTMRLVKIVRQAGFDGDWIIEYEGHSDLPPVGIKKSVALLSRCFAESE
ncbi:MAG TPA: TIM barrel protein [Capsulimonadaceae bacterium]|jgi:sugar phosphate isomerase/epimerase